MILRDLAEPFKPEEILWRVGNVTKNGQSATLLAYIDARAVMDRLDNVCGPHGWRDSYAPGPDGGICCAIAIKVGDEWVAKQDGAEKTQIEAVKGGYSDAFKRAAVKWGIGRYLYRLDARFHRIKEGWANGKGVDVSAKGQGHIGWIPYPALPSWATPGSGAEDPAPPYDPEADYDFEPPAMSTLGERDVVSIAEEWASQGREAFQGWWKNQGMEVRASLQADLDRLVAMAKKAEPEVAA